MKRYCDILGLNISEQECSETMDTKFDECQECKPGQEAPSNKQPEGKPKRKYTLSPKALEARQKNAKKKRDKPHPHADPLPIRTQTPESEGALEQGVKHDADKLRYDLVPPEALEEVVKVLTFGAQKYKDRNWEKGINYGRVYGALMRHMQAFWRGEDKDPESGISHLSHAGCCLFFLMTYEGRKMKQFDDRPITIKEN